MRCIGFLILSVFFFACPSEGGGQQMFKIDQLVTKLYLYIDVLVILHCFRTKFNNLTKGRIIEKVMAAGSL